MSKRWVNHMEVTYHLQVQCPPFSTVDLPLATSLDRPSVIDGQPLIDLHQGEKTTPDNTRI